MIPLLLTLLLLTAPVPAAPPRPPEGPTYDMLYIHHSVGIRWIFWGGLLDSLRSRELMEGRTIRLHMATYGDRIGWDTDVGHWNTKFRTRMREILTFDRHTNVPYDDPARRNRIVMFNSCYTCTAVKGVGSPPGDPNSRHRLTWDYVAAFKELAAILDDYPHILFIYVTSPPIGPEDVGRVRNYWDRPSNRWRPEEAARWRSFQRWLLEEWVVDYRRTTGLANVAVFNLFDIIAEPPDHPTHPGAIRKAFRLPGSSQYHPRGHWTATGRFVPFLQRALRRWEAQPFGPNRGAIPDHLLQEEGRGALLPGRYRIRLRGLPAPTLLALAPSPLPGHLPLGPAHASPMAGRRLRLQLPPVPALIGGALPLQAAWLPAGPGHPHRSNRIRLLLPLR